jgi:hypothetical protein
MQVHYHIHTHPQTHETFLSTLQVLPEQYRGAGKSTARPGRKQATVTEDFDVHISYL